MRNDLWVDFHRIDEDGLTLANARHARAGLNLFPGAYFLSVTTTASPPSPKS